MKISQQEQKQQKKQANSTNVFELQIPGDTFKIREEVEQKLISQSSKTKSYLKCVIFLLILLISLIFYQEVIQNKSLTQLPTKDQDEIKTPQHEKRQINVITQNNNNYLEKQKILNQREKAIAQREKILAQKQKQSNMNNNNNNNNYLQKQKILNQREKAIAQREKIVAQKQKQSNNKTPFVQPNKKIEIPKKNSIYSDNMSLTFKQPTLGMKTPGTKFNNSLANNNYRAYQQLFMQVFKPYNNTDCKMKRYGDIQDGGYLVCQNIMDKSQALLNFGIQGRDNFGCALTTAYNIPNFQYDCTNPNAPTCQTNKNMNFFSYSCVGDTSQQTARGKYLSLQDIIINRELTDKHFSIKIDIQGAEWPGFRTLPTKYLDNIDQLFMEIHYFNPHYWGNADIIKAIGEKFVTVSLHMNNNGCQYGERLFPSNAIEVLMVNKKLIKIKSETRSFALHNSFTPNNPALRECQINV